MPSGVQVASHALAALVPIYLQPHTSVLRSTLWPFASLDSGLLVFPLPSSAQHCQHHAFRSTGRLFYCVGSGTSSQAEDAVWLNTFWTIVG